MDITNSTLDITKIAQELSDLIRSSQQRVATIAPELCAGDVVKLVKSYCLLQVIIWSRLEDYRQLVGDSPNINYYNFSFETARNGEIVIWFEGTEDFGGCSQDSCLIMPLHYVLEPSSYKEIYQQNKKREAEEKELREKEAILAMERAEEDRERKLYQRLKTKFEHEDI